MNSNDSCIIIKNYTNGLSHIASRESALFVRKIIENNLKNNKVIIDFHDINATQGYIDELIGVLVMEHGSRVIDKLIFRNCSNDLKSIISFVVSDRMEFYI